jgi:hypothetical protein
MTSEMRAEYRRGWEAGRKDLRRGKYSPPKGTAPEYERQGYTDAWDGIFIRGLTPDIESLPDRKGNAQ